jgi:hypothetical protein
MSIVHIPKELQLSEPLACAICRVRLYFSKATVGLFDADNHQAFACVSHFSEVELLIVGWADFMAAERYKYEHRKREADALGVSSVWLNT